jgi:hypothetical protein
MKKTYNRGHEIGSLGVMDARECGRIRRMKTSRNGTSPKLLKFNHEKRTRHLPVKCFVDQFNRENKLGICQTIVETRIFLSGYYGILPISKHKLAAVHSLAIAL